jgi:hypothetical protein
MPLRRAQIVALTAAFWTLFGTVCALQVWLSMLAHNHSLPRVILYHVAVWDAWTLLTFGVARLARRVPVVPPSSRALLLHLLAGVVVGVLHGAWWVALELLIVPYDVMNPTVFTTPFVKTAFYQMPLELLLYALVVMTVYASDSYERYREREVSAEGSRSSWPRPGCAPSSCRSSPISSSTRSTPSAPSSTRAVTSRP